MEYDAPPHARDVDDVGDMRRVSDMRRVGDIRRWKEVS